MATLSELATKKNRTAFEDEQLRNRLNVQDAQLRHMQRMLVPERVEPWVEFSDVAAYEGWDTSPPGVTSSCYYRISRSAHLIQVKFAILGTSNSVNTKVRVPVANKNGYLIYFLPFRFTDNGTPSVYPGSGGCVGPDDSYYIDLYTDYDATGWTGSGTKQVHGYFILPYDD
jgi:hypothetical protein